MTTNTENENDGFIEIDPATIVASATVDANGAINVTLECRDTDGNAHEIESF